MRALCALLAAAALEQLAVDAGGEVSDKSAPFLRAAELSQFGDHERYQWLRLESHEKAVGFSEEGVAKAAQGAERLATARRLLPGVKVMAVVKGVPGPEAVEWVSALQGADYLGVDDPENALAIRRAGVMTPVLVLYPGLVAAERCGEFAAANIEVAVASEAWLRDCVAHGAPGVHVFADTGFGVSGAPVEEALQLLPVLRELGYPVKGFMTHLCCEIYGLPAAWFARHAKSEERTAVEEMHATQRTRVVDAARRWREAGGEGLVHAAASGAVVHNDTALFFDMVRMGRALVPAEWTPYDLEDLHAALDRHHLSRYPPGEIARLRQKYADPLEGKVVAVPHVEKVLPPGWCVGYYCWEFPGGPGRVAVLEAARRVAVVVDSRLFGKHLRCQDAATGRNLPVLMNSGAAGLLLDVANASRALAPVACEGRPEP